MSCQCSGILIFFQNIFTQLLLFQFSPQILFRGLSCAGPRKSLVLKAILLLPYLLFSSTFTASFSSSSSSSFRPPLSPSRSPRRHVRRVTLLALCSPKTFWRLRSRRRGEKSSIAREKKIVATYTEWKYLLIIRIYLDRLPANPHSYNFFLTSFVITIASADTTFRSRGLSDLTREVLLIDFSDRYYYCFFTDNSPLRIWIRLQVISNQINEVRSEFPGRPFCLH